MIENIIKSGDKINIKYLHQDNEKIYMSGVFDIISENEIEITVPTLEGKMVLFHNGVKLEFFFHTTKGMFSCEAVVMDRYKKDDFFLLSVKIISPLKKSQRRESYRFECLLDFTYYKIPKEAAKLKTTKDVFDAIAESVSDKQKKMAQTKEISGDGCKFLSAEPLEIGSNILMEIHLVNAKVDHMFYLVLEIIMCEEAKELEDRWIIHGKFDIKDKKDRDLIVRYVFEEDRMLRKKEIGEA